VTRRHHGELGAPAGAGGARCSSTQGRKNDGYQEEEDQRGQHESQSMELSRRTRKEGVLHCDAASILNYKKTDEGYYRASQWYYKKEGTLQWQLVSSTRR
jgi:hypothetical protein